MIKRWCYKDCNRCCDDTCAAYGSSSIYGADAYHGTSTGNCIELARSATLASSIYSLASEVKELRNALGIYQRNCSPERE